MGPGVRRVGRQDGQPGRAGGPPVPIIASPRDDGWPRRRFVGVKPTPAAAPPGSARAPAPGARLQCTAPSAAPTVTPAPATSTTARCGLLEGQALTCRRGRRRLFENLSLALVPGTITWLRGTNGSGKTSLMRILAGLSAPAAGSVLWDGRPLAATGRAARDGTLYIGHANALKDDLTLLESLTYLAQLAEWPDAGARA
ncbi:MAG: ATP-binding cassette domain-containing protein, partial [Burkholderiales bacterium]|nr:ATP-binding cassette domain-containing protein [Burkholderiales bacterium]